ncbi:MAG TPA: hypothetical protein VG295_04485 [Solirubrobacteraceae bacterium]|jgi:hypothetical protein|nr:hypothetical protein [Solirubrobacteraceae bacterium]
MELKSLVSPNTYELSGEGTQITYRTGGPAELAYSGPKGEQVFSGDDITVQDTALGTEVTVTLEDIADMHVVTLTAFLPEMWVAPRSGQEFETIAVLTTKEEPITAEAGFPAARESYATMELSGEGKRTEP